VIFLATKVADLFNQYLLGERHLKKTAGSLVVVVAISLSLVSCQSVKTTNAGLVGVDREQRMAVSAQAIEQSANKQYAQLMAQADKKGKRNSDPAQYTRVRAIADKLILQTPAFRQDAKGWQWEINLLTSPEVNAWCMPGGKIAVYTGLIEKLNITDDELAAARAAGRPIVMLGQTVLRTETAAIVAAALVRDRLRADSLSE
jgi:Zn-dependent protease with chaperone function